MKDRADFCSIVRQTTACFHVCIVLRLCHTIGVSALADSGQLLSYSQLGMTVMMPKYLMSTMATNLNAASEMISQMQLVDIATCT
jgi:hypothetical protein